ncbi:Cilia- and flagella-associated protein 52 [Cichlidogyrus casuarinus]|uniref:Cilia- and flagella-associated protein 52 n=1 Tax=Cichlidogyrus casuarinus TaxID=1844966 RepID=A0ABD2QDS2_9PLAT
MENVAASMTQMKLRGVVGIKGQIPNGLMIHPNNKHMIYTLGCAVIIEEIDGGHQEILQGHSNDVVCADVSKCGTYLASGQATHMGFMADIIVWDFASRIQLATYAVHKVRVTSIHFSTNSKYIISLGGQDDGCVIVWSLEKRTPLCGATAQPQSSGITHIIAPSHTNDNIFISAGDNSIRTWEIDAINRKIRPTECKVGSIKRIVTCAVITPDDEFFICGTTTGDMLCIKLSTATLSFVFPEKNRYSLGVTALCIIQNKTLIVGTGDGTLQAYSICHKDVLVKFKKELSKKCELIGNVTAITPRGLGHQFFVATDKCHVYRFKFCEFAADLVTTCHYSAVNDIKFPHNCSDLFVTCGFQDVRVFHVPSRKELLRINIPNMTCFAVDILRNGSAIVSGWDDSRIRAFYPETGHIMYTINDAHKKGVTALASTSTGQRLISGGGEGQVRVWEINEVPSQQRIIPYGHGATRGRGDKKKAEVTYVSHLIATMKEHANAVSSIKVNKSDTSCVSSSADGTCIVWCLEKFRRKQIIFANTLFRAVCYHPEECQMITSGTDRKIGYWELYDGSMIRELDGSRSGSINGMDISVGGEIFVTGGDDRLIKVWNYSDGDVTAIGIGHSSAITRVKIAPDQKFIVSVCEDGGIFIWDMPEQTLDNKSDSPDLDSGVRC